MTKNKFIHSKSWNNGKRSVYVFLHWLKFPNSQIYFCFLGSTKTTRLAFYLILKKWNIHYHKPWKISLYTKQGQLHMKLDQLTILIIVIQIYIYMYLISDWYLLSDAMKLYTWFRTTLLGRIAIFSMSILWSKTILCFLRLRLSSVISKIIHNIDIVWWKSRNLSTSARTHTLASVYSCGKDKLVQSSFVPRQLVG